jgi:hypothetical protein
MRPAGIEHACKWACVSARGQHRGQHRPSRDGPERHVFGFHRTPGGRGCNTFCGTLLGMARTIQARLDERSEEDLALLRNEGHSDSEAVRLALHEAAELRRRKSALRLEAEAAASDPDDLAEARRVREQMDAIAAAWSDAG